MRAPPVPRTLHGDAQPLSDHPDAHDDVAQDHHTVLEVRLIERMEHLGDAERDQRHTDHLHQGDNAEEPVVGVEGRREPGEVDPRPDGREGAQQEADERVAEVTFGDLMCRRGAGEGERDDEDEVVEELQTGRDPPLLVRIATGHRA